MHLLITVDKFTKWIEARPISMIKSEQAMQFFLDIIHCFGVLDSIITNNGTQFMRKKFHRFCDDYQSMLIGPPWCTPAQTGRLSARTTWSCKASSLESSTD
jgi:hypothetical protein